MLKTPLRQKLNHGKKYLFTKIVTCMTVFFIILAPLMPIAVAAEVGDVVTAVASNLGSPKFDFGTEDVTGLNIKMHMARGDFGSGLGALSVVGPVDDSGMKALFARIVDVAGQTGATTTPMKGGEVREYQMAKGIGLTVKLPDYLITVEIYKTGNSVASDMQTAKKLAQALLDGLERNGLLKQPAPRIDGSAVSDKKVVPASAAVVTGKPLDKPLVISNTDNIAGVKNGPTAPTTFSLNKPHLLTYIRNYHWNKGKGSSLGTIAVRDQNGKIYGPWQAKGTPGMGGVPDANWEVTPNVVLPTGTYTVVDSDPTTWSANAESGGRGMGQVHATPNFEVTSGTIKKLNEKLPGDIQKGSSAGVGSVGNIPGPTNTTEAVVGVVIPGLIATGMGALAGLGGGGGFSPPGGTPLVPTGGGGSSSGGGSSPVGGNGISVIQDVTQLGRRRREGDLDTARIDTTDMFKEQKPLTVGTITEANKSAAGAGLIIGSADEIAKVGSPTFVSKNAGISIDTSALEKIDLGKALITGEGAAVSDEISGSRKATTQTEASGSSANSTKNPQDYDADGFNKDGFNKDGFNKDGFNKDGFNKDGFNKDGFNKDGFNKDGFNKDGFNKDGFNKDGFNKDGFNKDGFNKDGFNKDGFNKDGFNKDGFNKAGFNKDGFNKDGFNKDGFNKDGFNKDGFNKDGFNKDGFNKAGFNKDGFNKDGFDKDGFNKDGFNKDGFNKDGFNKDGFNKDGFNKDDFNKDGFNKDGFNKDGFNKDGFNKDGFNKDGFNKDGFNKDGFNKDGFNKDGFNKDGFNKDGFNKDGFNKDGFNKAGFNKDGFSKAGFNKEGFDKDGFDVNGYNAKGYNPSGYDAKGYNSSGYDKKGYNQEGWDKDGYDRNGLNKGGFDKEGYNKKGFDKAGYNREGFNKEGKQREGYDEYGYDKKGFNKAGFDKDGYDRGGFNYDGYNRSGFDPWGFNRQGYGKDGFHWSGYNSDGYDRTGRHWSKNPTEGDSPFNVDTRSPFDGGPVVIGKWNPTKPALGEPYPRTVEKYGAKPWTTEQPIAKPVQPEKDSGIIGPKDPMNTLKHHGEEKSPLGGQDKKTPGDAPSASREGGFPLDGDKKVLVGTTDGRSTEIEYDGKTGEWKNTKNGNSVDPDKFQKWQDDLAEDRRRSAEDIDKMSQRTDANSKAIDETMADWKKIDQMQKTAEKHGIGEVTGPGDVDKAIQDLKDDMLANKTLDHDKMDRINKVIDSRIKGDSLADTGSREAEKPWYEDIDSALKANLETAREVVTGQDAEGNISWVGIGARTAIGAASGGASEYILTVAEALSRVKEGIDKNESGFRATARAIGMVVMEESVSRYLEGASKLGFGEMARRFPVLTNKVADMIETGLLKIAKADQAASSALGLISKEGAVETIEQINKQLAEKTADVVADGTGHITNSGQKVISGASDDAVSGTGKVVSGAGDDVVKAKKTVQGTMDDFEKLPTAKQQELIKEQAIYDEYRIQAEEKTWKLSDKVQRREPISVEDVLDMKADPASMRTLKDVNHVDGLGTELGTGGARQLKTEFNNTLNTHVYQPSYKDVQDSLSTKFGGAEIRVEPVRTPGKECNPWDINTDNDIIALRKVDGPNGPEWVEVPRKEWEDVYFKSYAKNTGFNPTVGAQKFPTEDWSKMTGEQQVKKWAELHGESPTDVYHPEGARDFSTQRTAMAGGHRPEQGLYDETGKLQRTALDPEGLGMMEKNKINSYWGKGDLKNQTEAMEQLNKAGTQAQALEKGYKEMGYKIADMPDNMKKAIDVVNDRGLSPATRAARLQELGYDTPGDFVDKIASRIGAVRAARR